MNGYLIRVRGQVQGVGFRPFVWQLARRFGASGDVANDAEGVLIRVSTRSIDDFVAALRRDAPPLSRIDSVEVSPLHADLPEDFVIAASGHAGAETRVTPDAATCVDCGAEIRDPGERRHGYAFANCTNCGPRFTILNGLPYDRARTSMAAFEMCPDCAREYADPADRRFHAQPVACPACGPRLWLEAGDTEVQGEPIAEAARLLSSGAILAVKGLGGFHLACDATNAETVALLRRRKRRPGKPFALIGTLETIRRHAHPTPAEEALLADAAAPIVLLPAAGAPLPDALAPGQATLGWMLPYTPLHHLLLDAVGRPLVMTSGNVSGEPQVIGNDEAREKLGGFVDGFLMHDRDIVRRLDDSVERLTPHGPMVLRRARGRVPGTLRLPPGFEDAPQAVAFGGQLKAAICLAKNGQVLLSHHLGDLDDALTWDEFRRADRDYAELFDHKPEVFACDLHPDFRATRHAEVRAGARPLVRVQHHHAHLAACLAENLWPRDGGPVAGVILDGLGLGPDGTVWGGEVLLGDYADVSRAAWLRPAPLVGGDAAQRDPWRNALVRLDQAGLAEMADRLLADYPLAIARRAVAAGVNAPLSSSAGRLFDAVAGILGVAAGGQSYEGEAAMLLEALAAVAPAAEPYPFDGGPGEIDPAPMVRAVARDLAAGTPGEIIAARAHAGIARAFCGAARALVEQGDARAVALSGGCFQNATLLGLCLAELDGLPVLIHTKTPANDGGLALGQVVVALSSALESR
jgi:hydrogenase maturation protein HypF